MPTLYHRTTAQAAKAILEVGFRDAKRHFGSNIEFEGVWLSDVPRDSKDFGHTGRDTLLAVTLDDADLGALEVLEEGTERSYREWIVPAAVINAKGKVRIVPADEEKTDPVER